jgi:5-methylcytosine-specific restriction endonuclease McrA
MEQLVSRAWSKGSTRRWRRTRAAVLAENARINEGRCTLALPGVCTGVATQVHHVAGKQAGDDPRLLVACCGECNRHVGNPQRTATGIRRVSKW